MWREPYLVTGPSLANVHGEAFEIGDEVAKLPDCAHLPKLHGIVRVVLYAGFHVAVDWKDYALLDVHIDRITKRST